MSKPDELFENGTLPEMMSHWYAIKKEYPENFLLAYRMGDFYEFFYGDAVKVSQLLGLTLTNRGTGPTRHPLAGIPHKATQYFRNLVKLGQTLIIVEQLEDPKTVKGRIVKRGVVKILSPGTIVDDNLLDSKTSNYICSIYREKKNFGLALIELSSGDFFITEFYGKDTQRMLFSFLTRYNPVECVLTQELVADSVFVSELQDNIRMIVKEHSQFQFLYQNAFDTLKKQLKVEQLTGFGVEGKNLAICAAGGLLSFLMDTQKESLANITRVRMILDENYMFLDGTTQHNLELLHNASDGTEYGSLYSILDNTKTPMGTRLLKTLIVQPLLEKAQIEERLDLVAFFISNNDIRQGLREILAHIGDLARLITRINYSSTANARDLLSIKNSLKLIKEIKSVFNKTENPLIKRSINELQEIDSLVDLIERSIHDQPPITITEGGVIKDGYNSQVDELRNIINHGKDWVISFEEKEKNRLGIGLGLKVSFNRVIGYFIQITDNGLENVKLPPDYVQRQTVKGGVRFETTQLKEMETKILSADENIKNMEYKIFQEIRAEVQKATIFLQKNAEILAIFDVFSSFAENALNYNYCRPQIATHQKIIIKQGRHPVVERLLKKESFVPNDSLLNTENDQILIITGPNWSGKSTYLRQCALLCLMSQIGSYVPAKEAEIGIVDRIFTRIGASDDLTRGQSTFMLEMSEMAQILHYATTKSLIIIDELGRGTGTADGQAIAQAVIEYLHDLGIKTLFSTHFHQLTGLKLPRIHNYHFKIIETPDSKKLIFVRQLVDGGTDKSYGIHVAMMTGLPAWVTDRAFVLMESGLCNGQAPIIPDPSQTKLTPIPSTSTESKVLLSVEANATNIPKKVVKKVIQTSLFPTVKINDSELVIMLRSVDLDNITPLQAFEFLKKIKNKLNSG